MAERGTIEKIAERCGVNQATVRRALASAGMKSGRGGYTIEEAVAAVNAIADPARINGHAATRVSGNGGGAMLDARTRHEELKARRLEIDNAKAEGELINRAAVTETGVHIIAMARTALLSLGHRLAEKVANKADVKEISKIIEDEVRVVLGALSNSETFLATLETEALS
jgi:hypothetical protein